jgi:hypothetical protein
VMDLTQESVHTTDNKDIGDIEAMNKHSIVVKRGFRDLHYYYIPISKVRGWDGHIVWLSISESEVMNNYERNEQPDRLKYYTKERGYSDTDVRNTRDELPSIPLISQKGRETLL